ncbi:MAG: hypothetical protein LBJ64_06370 [Deltaproteobacteria bacterium]|jgi:hypothetical protein|nr:hypothetical protein [Deltaproteobacteria bacterium]
MEIFMVLFRGWLDGSQGLVLGALGAMDATIPEAERRLAKSPVFELAPERRRLSDIITAKEADWRDLPFWEARNGRRENVVFPTDESRPLAPNRRRPINKAINIRLNALEERPNGTMAPKRSAPK